MPAHVPSVPTGVSQTLNRTFLSGLSILDRSYAEKLVRKYGNENYTFVLDMIGAKRKTDNRDFYHYETRKRHQSFAVASITGGASAGVSAVLTLAAGSHYDSGTKSPIRVGEVIMWANNGRLAKITAINTATPSAHTATVFPLKSTEQFNPAASDVMYCLGIQHAGEASDVHAAVQPLVDKITNTCTEIREDYRFTDKAGMEVIEFDSGSGKYYQRFGTQEAEKRFLNNREFLTVFSVDVTNTNITSNGTVGTKGLLQQVTSGGGSLTYTGGSMNVITDFQAVTRELLFNGANSEIHHLCDIYQFQELQSKLFTQYNNGAILWASAGGSKEVAAALGFSSYAIDGFNFHFKPYAGFQPERVYGVVPTGSYPYKNFGLMIPQGFGNDPNGQAQPTISLRYQEIPGKGEINAYEWGGLAPRPTNGVQELVTTMIGHYGVQVSAANQCLTWKG